MSGPLSESEMLQQCNTLWNELFQCPAPTNETIIVVKPYFRNCLRHYYNSVLKYGYFDARNEIRLFGCEVLVSDIEENWRLLVKPSALIRREVIK